MVAHRNAGILTLICLLALPVSVKAQAGVPLSSSRRWLRVVRTADLTAYIDRESVNQLLPGDIETWNLWEFAKPQGRGSERFDAVMFRWQIDCRQRRLKPTEAIFYRGRTSVHSESPLEDWQSPPPESTGEMILLQSCRLAAGQPVDTVP